MGGDKIIVYMGFLFYKVTNLGPVHLYCTGATLQIIPQIVSDFKQSSSRTTIFLMFAFIYSVLGFLNLIM